MKSLFTPLRAALGLMATLLVVACVTSDKPLLPTARALTPLPEVFWIQDSPDTEPTRYREVRRTGNQYIMRSAEGNELYKLTFASLGTTDPDTYLVQNEGSTTGISYAIAKLRSTGVFYYTPTCSDDLSPEERADLGVPDVFRPGQPDWISCNYTSFAQIEKAVRLVEKRKEMKPTHFHAFRK